MCLFVLCQAWPDVSCGRQYVRLPVTEFEVERLKHLGFDAEPAPDVMLVTFLLPDGWHQMPCDDNKDRLDGDVSCLYDENGALQLAVTMPQPEHFGELVFYNVMYNTAFE